MNSSLDIEKIFYNKYISIILYFYFYFFFSILLYIYTFVLLKIILLCLELDIFCNWSNIISKIFSDLHNNLPTNNINYLLINYAKEFWNLIFDSQESRRRKCLSNWIVRDMIYIQKRIIDKDYILKELMNFLSQIFFFLLKFIWRQEMKLASFHTSLANSQRKRIERSYFLCESSRIIIGSKLLKGQMMTQ